MAYAAEHITAYRAVLAAGAAVTTATGVTGAAMRVRGNPDTYRALSLIESKSPTLLFVPTTYGGALPPLSDTLVFGGTTYTVVDVNPTAPDGTPIFARLVVGV